MFVRTKDKIIKVDETGYIKEIDVCGKKSLFLFNKNYLFGREVINQADSIEELCDGFIGITTKEYPNRPDIEPFIHYFQKPFEFEYGNNVIKHLKLIDVELKNQNGWIYSTKHWFESCDIYGFVRTKKGLIYVAKMNDKGELVLCQN